VSDLRGADPATVRRALETGESLPGTAGFAGELDGCLLRDVLGRQPLFYEADATDTDESVTEQRSRWAFDPTRLSEPVRLPAGAVRDADGLAATWSLPDPAPTADGQCAIAAVRNAIERSVGAVDAAGLAVGFSGGVDSATVATGVPEAPRYVVGFEGAKDIDRARQSGRAMGGDSDLRVVELSHVDVERAVPAVVAATGRTGAMDVAIGMTLYLLGERVAADGFDRLAIGQGVDELFGGYAKIATPGEHSHADADTVRGARLAAVLDLPDGLERDFLALRAAGVEPVAPLLHDRVVRAALSLPESLLATPDQRKIAFRRATEGLLPDSVRCAEKNAAQYGSFVARELDRLARQAGFKRRMDDHVEQYVASLVADASVEVPNSLNPDLGN
jgi:asparagine synthase (glutamine-hydrolysing)